MSKVILILIALGFFVSTLPVNASRQTPILEVSPRIPPVRPVVNINDKDDLNLLTLLNVTKDITVSAGGDVQAAFDSPVCGDTIIIEAAASFTVPLEGFPFVLRNRGHCEANPIIIRTSNLAGIPAESQRISPANGPSMPKLVSSVSTAVLEAEAGANGYKLIGIEITNAGNTITNSLVEIGRRAQSSYMPTPQQPHHITFDRCWIHEATNDTTTPHSAETTSIIGMVINAQDINVINSRIAGFRGFYKGTTNIAASVAILFPYSAQRVNVTNNYLDAWFVNVFFGGTGSAESPNTSTLTSATLAQATFSNVGNLKIGDLVGFKVTGGKNSLGPVPYQVARVTGINENVVDYVPQFSSLAATLQGGNPLQVAPDVPGDARWEGYLPTDILIERNQFVLDWEATEAVWTRSGGSPSTTYPFTSYGNGPKGQIEIKVGKRVTINANTFEGWYNTFTLTTRNQTNILDAGGAPWATIEDLRITNNWWKKSPNWNRQFADGMGGPQLEDNEYTSKRGKNVLIENNLWESGTEALLKMGAADNVTLRHNTFPGTMDKRNASMVINLAASSPGFVFQDNILPNNEYGLNCQVVGGDCWPGKVQDHNVIIDNRSADVKNGDGSLQPRYPMDFITASQSAAGWADQSTGDYRLSASSPYKGKASDGTDPGVDMDKLLTALGGASTPLPSPTPSPSPTPTATPLPSPTPTATPVSSPSPSPIPTPQPSPSPEPSPSPTPTPTPQCLTSVNSPNLPQWSFGVLRVTLTGMNGLGGSVTVIPSSGQVQVSPGIQRVSGTSAIAEFQLYVKRKSSSVTVSGPCGSMTVWVNVQ